jgi:hypothetical protein
MHAARRVQTETGLLQTICRSAAGPEHSRESQPDQTAGLAGRPIASAKAPVRGFEIDSVMSVGGIGGSDSLKSTPERSGSARSIKHAHSCPSIDSSLCEQTHNHSPSSVHRCLSPTAHHPPPSALTMSEAAPPTDSRALSIEITHHFHQVCN